MDIKELDVLGDAVEGHWYYRSKARALEQITGNLPCERILDVGAGSGFFSRWLLRQTDVERAICVDTEYQREWQEEHNGKSMAFSPSVSSADVDLVLMMDVLEHVDDDVGLLHQYMKLVPPGTSFVISVPAFQFLWSSHDVFLEHKRRYTASSLLKVVEEAGLEVQRIHYYFALVFPLALLTRLAGRVFSRSQGPAKSQMRQHGRLTNALLELLCRVELPLMKLNRLGGLTVFCRGRKR